MNSRIVIRLGAVRRHRLERTWRETRDADFRTRITIVLLFDRSFRSPHIAEVVGRAPATVVRVAHRFLEHGEDGLEDGRRANGTNKVDADLLQALAELVNRLPEEFGLTRPTWTREALRKVLAEETDVWLSVTTVGRMLKKLGARWGMPKPIVACPWSPQRKGRRIKQIRRVVENLGPNEVAYYEDEVDIHLNPKIGRDWMHRGEQKEVLTPGQNKKHYIAGALAVDGSDFVFVEATCRCPTLTTA